MYSVPNHSVFGVLKFLLKLTICILYAQLPLVAQSADSVPASIEPGLKPAETSTAWKQLVGIYSTNRSNSNFVLFERGHHLFRQAPNKAIQEVAEIDGMVWLPDETGGRTHGYREIRDAVGNVTALNNLAESYPRLDAGADPKHFFHVTPSAPLDELRAQALQSSPPVEQGSFRKPELVELDALDPLFRLDIRYAKPNNFLSTAIYTQARAFLQRPAAEALIRVLNKLRALGYGLLIYDAYRPWYVTRIFWDATPAADHVFVADPQKGSKHNRGCAVDLTLYDLSTGEPIEMPGLYDEMSPRSFPTFPGGTSLQRWHRDLLRRAMESEGFTVNEDEWWHFDYKDWKHYPILNVPFERLGEV
jgi:D-alanyl-D-alanine dipeptidase